MYTRDRGVRSAGIVDFDVLNDYSEFEKHLKDLEFSDEQRGKALSVQKAIADAAKAASPDNRLAG